MKRLFVAAAAVGLAASLTACDVAPASPSSTAVISKLDQVEARYHQAKAFVNLFVALASPDRQDEVRAIEAKIEAALTRARAAATIAEQLLELRAAEAHIAELNAAR